MSAVHLSLGESVAVKFLHPSLLSDPESVERFMREARATSRIKHEHVVRVFDVGTSDRGIPYIAMELLVGQDLGRMLEDGPLTLMLAVDCVLQTAEALAEAHAAGIVHRDIKPSNICLLRRSDGSPQVKVLDFGISKLVTSGDDQSRLTSTRAVFGSPTYMSPEQLRSAKRVDGRTDIWALGVVLHELLTGRCPFEGDNVSGILASIAADPPIPLRAHRRDVPAAVEAAVLSCLEKDPTRRVTLAELANRLRTYGSVASHIAAERIGRVPADATPGTRASLPAPSVLAVGADLGPTEPQLATTQSVDGSRAMPVVVIKPSRTRLVASGIVGLFVLAVGGGAVALQRRAPGSGARAHWDLPASPPLPAETSVAADSAAALPAAIASEAPAQQPAIAPSPAVSAKSTAARSPSKAPTGSRPNRTPAAPVITPPAPPNPLAPTANTITQPAGTPTSLTRE